MTIINYYTSEEEKKQIKELVEQKKIKSMSEFIRDAVNMELIIEAKKKKKPSDDELVIPDYIPKNKYVLFTYDKIIAAVGDSPQDVAGKAAEKDIEPPFIIRYNGNDPVEPIHYAYMSLSKGKAWEYLDFNGFTYPMVKLRIKSNKLNKNFSATIDSSATLCMINENKVKYEDLQATEFELPVSTANGVITKRIYKGEITLLDESFQIEFMVAPIDSTLPFDFLIGRNLLDQLDTYLFGKKKVMILRTARE